MNEQLVTINILSFNRKEELQHTLTKVYQQDYKNIEVIVVDNASSDGTQAMVKNEYPEVNLIELKENIGIAGWNKGFEEANGEYVLVLDDDSYPEIGTIRTGLKTMTEDDKIGVIGFTIYNAFYNLIENIEELKISQGNIIDVKGFIGCGALIRKDIFRELGGFEPNIFIYYNEIEFSIRAKNSGFKILFDPSHRVVHTYSSLQRNSPNKRNNITINERRFENSFRSYFIYLFLHFSTKYVLKYSIKLILSKLYIAFKLRFLRTFFVTLFSLYGIRKSILSKRQPVKHSIQKEYNYGNLKFIDLYAYQENSK